MDQTFKGIPIHELVKLYNKLRQLRYRRLEQQVLYEALENYLWDEYRL